MTDDKKLIYISGPISGNPDWRVDFINAEQLVNSQLKGFTAINPLCFNLAYIPKMDWAGQMIVCLINLSKCDAILMLDGWEKSYGARIEKLFAEKLGLEVLYLKNLNQIYENGTGKD